MVDKVVSSGALALVSEALFAKKFWELMVRLEVASLVSGNTIGCLLEEKAIRDKSKRVCTSHRSVILKEKLLGRKIKKSGAISKVFVTA